MKRCFLIFILSWAVIFTASAASSNKLYHEYKLHNGLKLIVKEDHRAPVVISQVWYKVGSSYEPAGLTGISHVLEHMMFKGTKKYPAGALSKLVSTAGGQFNAFTNYDYTGYYEMLPKESLELSFKLESDRMRNLLLKEEDFKKEVQVVMEERRMRTEDNPQALTFERFMAGAFVANPYHHPVVGWMEDLKQLTLDDISRWYKQWYAPNNAIIVVVGDVNPTSVLKLTKKYFSRVLPKRMPEQKKLGSIPPMGKRTLVVERPAKLPWLVMGFNVPVLNSAPEVWEPYALDVIAAVLDAGKSARFTRELVRGKEVAATASTNYDLFDRLDTVFMIMGTPASDHTISELQIQFAKQIERLQNERVSDEELSRIKAQVVADKVFKKDSISAQAFEIGAVESIGQSWEEVENYVQRIESVTPAQIQQVAQKYFTPERLTIATLVPLPIKDNKPQPQFTPGGPHVR